MDSCWCASQAGQAVATPPVKWWWGEEGGRRLERHGLSHPWGIDDSRASQKADDVLEFPEKHPTGIQIPIGVAMD